MKSKFQNLPILKTLGNLYQVSPTLVTRKPAPKIKIVDDKIHLPPNLSYEEKNLTSDEFRVLDQLTDEANSLIQSQADLYNKEFSNFKKDNSDQELQDSKEDELKKKLAQYVAKVFKEKFDYETNKEYPFLSHPLIQVAVLNSQSSNFSEARATYDELEPNFIFGMFKIPYIQGLETPKVGWMSIEKSFMELELDVSKSRVSSKTESSKELSDPSLVGLFTESWLGKNNPNSFTIYFADRFYKRFNEITKKLLNPFRDAFTSLAKDTSKYSRFIRRKANKFLLPLAKQVRMVSENTFKNLQNITDLDVKKAVGRWLTRHESYHRTGKLPRVNSAAPEPGQVRTEDRTIADIGYVLKNSFEAGAWEEMRVDLLSLLDFGSDSSKSKLSSSNVSHIRDFVLAERLLRYPVEHDINDSFDAVVSQVLLNWFIDKGAIDNEEIYTNHVLDMGSKRKISLALVGLAEEMESIETEIFNGFEAELSASDHFKSLLENKDLSDNKFNREVRKLDSFKDARAKIHGFMQKWANWHLENAPATAVKNTWAPELSELAKPARKIEDPKNRKREDLYEVHPYVVSLRNMKYYQDNKRKLDTRALAV